MELTLWKVCMELQVNYVFTLQPLVCTWLCWVELSGSLQSTAESCQPLPSPSLDQCLWVLMYFYVLQANPLNRLWRLPFGQTEESLFEVVCPAAVLTGRLGWPGPQSPAKGGGLAWGVQLQLNRMATKVGEGVPPKSKSPYWTNPPIQQCPAGLSSGKGTCVYPEETSETASPQATPQVSQSASGGLGRLQLGS